MAIELKEKTTTKYDELDFKKAYEALFEANQQQQKQYRPTSNIKNRPSCINKRLSAFS